MELFLEVHEWLAGMILASARIMPSFFLLPFLNNNILVGSVRMPIVMIVGAALWPYNTLLLNEFNVLHYLGLLFKEILIGMFLAFFFCIPFWVMHAAGCVIDNQRGATLSSNFDPVSGVDTSELANLYNLLAAAIFLCAGGMELILKAFRTSYQISDPLTFSFPALWPLLTFLTYLVGQALLVASPVIASFLLLEAILGLLSRYAPQMNAFGLALTMKSVVAFFIILIYFSSTIPTVGVALMFKVEIIKLWF